MLISNGNVYKNFLFYSLNILRETWNNEFYLKGNKTVSFTLIFSIFILYGQISIADEMWVSNECGNSNQCGFSEGLGGLSL